MEGKTTASSQKANKREVGVVHEDPNELKTKLLNAGIGDFKMVASFWSTTLQNMKTFAEDARSKVSNFLEFDNGKVIPSEAFQLHIDSVMLKLHLKKDKDKLSDSKKKTAEEKDGKASVKKVATKSASDTRDANNSGITGVKKKVAKTSDRELKGREDDK